MAVRFSADGEDFTRALGLGAQTAYTITCWVKISAARAFSTAWSVDNGTGDVDVLQTDGTNTTTMELYSDGSNPTIVAMTAGAWYFIAISRSGTGGTGYYRTDGGGALTTVSLAGSSSSTNIATLRLGESPWGGEWLNGCLENFKLWTAALTQTEIEDEAVSFDAVRTANLVAEYHFEVAETTDYSGNGNTLSGGAGTSTEDGPTELDSGSGEITGSGAVTAPAAQADGSGQVVVAGSGAVLSPAPAVDGSGGVLVAGSGDASSPAAQADGAGSVVVAGSGEAVAPASHVEGENEPLVTLGMSMLLARGAATATSAQSTASRASSIHRAGATSGPIHRSGSTSRGDQ